MATFVVYQSRSISAGPSGSKGVFSVNDNPNTSSITPVNIALTGVMLSIIPEFSPSIATQPWTWNPLVNGNPVVPTVTVTPPATNVYQTGFSINYSQGDNVQHLLQVINPTIPPSPPNWNPINVGVAYNPSALFQNLCLLSTDSDIGIGSGPPLYMGLTGVTLVDTYEPNVQIMWPVAGTFQGLAIKYTTSPGGAGTISLRRNGSTVWLIPLPSTNGSDAILIDTSTTASVSAGDMVNYQLIYTGGDPNGSVGFQSVILGFRSP